MAPLLVCLDSLPIAAYGLRGIGEKGDVTCLSRACFDGALSSCALANTMRAREEMQREQEKKRERERRRQGEAVRRGVQ